MADDGAIGTEIRRMMRDMEDSPERQARRIDHAQGILDISRYAENELNSMMSEPRPLDELLERIDNEQPIEPETLEELLDSLEAPLEDNPPPHGLPQQPQHSPQD